MQKNKQQKNDLAFLIKNFFLEKKEYFISIFSFILVILFGVVAKSFFVLREYFWYFFSGFLVLVLIFIYFVREKKEFQIFLEISLEEDRKKTEELKKKKNKKIDFYIKILSYILLFILMIFLLWARYTGKIII